MFELVTEIRTVHGFVQDCETTILDVNLHLQLRIPNDSIPTCNRRWIVLRRSQNAVNSFVRASRLTEGFNITRWATIDENWRAFGGLSCRTTDPRSAWMWGGEENWRVLKAGRTKRALVTLAAKGNPPIRHYCKRRFISGRRVGRRQIDQSRWGSKWEITMNLKRLAAGQLNKNPIPKYLSRCRALRTYGLRAFILLRISK